MYYMLCILPTSTYNTLTVLDLAFRFFMYLQQINMNLLSHKKMKALMIATRMMHHKSLQIDLIKIRVCDANDLFEYPE